MSTELKYGPAITRFRMLMTTAGWSGRNDRTIGQEAIKQGPEML